MNFDIYEYIINLEDEKKKKRFFKFCFNQDLECKKNGFYPNSFSFFNKKFKKEEILYASKIYLDFFATKDEKKLYYLINERFILTMPKSLKDHYSNYKKAFNIYLKKGVFSKEFLKLAMEFKCDIEDLLEYPTIYNMMYATKEERDLYKNSKYDVITRKNIEKFYYKLCMSFNFDYNTILQMQLLLNKKMSYLISMLDLYIKKNLNGKMPNEYKKFLIEYNFKNYKKLENKLFFLQLEKIDNKEEIIRFLLESSKTPDVLLKELDDYIKKCRSIEILESAKSVQENLQEKILLFKEYYQLTNNSTKNKLNLDKNTLEVKEDLVLKYLDTNLTESEFCKNNEITEKEFRNILLILKKNESKIYQKYLEKMKLLTDKNNSQLLILIKIMLEQLEFGIAENGEIREFDILDYFLLFKVPFKSILRTCNSNLSEKEIFKIRSFMKRNNKLFMITPENIEDILNEKIIFNVEFDQNNLPILNTGHEVTREEKIEVIEELKKDNIHYYQVYQKAINRKFNNYPKTHKRK